VSARTPESDAGGAATDREPARQDLRVEQIIGRLLQRGVLLAAIVVAVGGVALLARHGSAPADFRSFEGESSALRSLAGIVRGALRFDSHAVVQLGVVLLLATPVARVALTLWAFAVQRDRLYVAMTALVLALLLFSLVGGG